MGLVVADVTVCFCYIWVLNSSVNAKCTMVICLFDFFGEVEKFKCVGYPVFAGAG